MRRQPLRPSTRASLAFLLTFASATCATATFAGSNALRAQKPAAEASLRLPVLFADSMVLQRGKPIPVWGWAKPGAEVRVFLGSKSKKAVADDKGRWRVDLDAVPKPGGPYTLRVRADRAITIKDVLVGDVWVCSGQSNMQWRVPQAANPKAEIAAARYPKIRLLTVPRNARVSAQSDIKAATWQRCDPSSIKNFSAVGYYFGRHLHNNLYSGLTRVPIGLISTNWGGTPVEAWMPEKLLEGDEVTDPILTRWEKHDDEFPERDKQYRAALDKWNRARKAGESAGRRPRAPRGPRHQHHPGVLWNGMVAPLVPFAIRGAIWYQGESNGSRGEQYATLFPRMIEHWRSAWGYGFPFYWVQLANYKTRNDPLCWAELRESQTSTLRLPNTGQALAIDIGNSRDIHPKNKQEVGRRLALIALRREYGQQKVDDSGPRYAGIVRKGKQLLVKFESENGLSLRVDANEKRPSFEIAQGDGDFVPARAKILDATTIALEADGVDAPSAVRYCWRDDPAATVFDKGGLPATPFRSDKRKRVTAFQY